MITRIYKITDNSTNESRLVEASSAAQAIRHCTARKYDAKAANPKDIAECMSKGIKLEKAGMYDIPDIPRFEAEQVQQ